MPRPCQQCGRPCTFERRHKGRKYGLKARDDHDLCSTCWQNMMEGLRALDRKEGEVKK